MSSSELILTLKKMDGTEQVQSFTLDTAQDVMYAARFLQSTSEKLMDVVLFGAQTGE